MLKNILLELGVVVPHPMMVKLDNKGATFLYTNPECHSKMKHIAMDMQYVNEKVGEGSMIVQHITEIEQKANSLKKALRPKSFTKKWHNLVEVLP